MWHFWGPKVLLVLFRAKTGQNSVWLGAPIAWHKARIPKNPSGKEEIVFGGGPKQVSLNSLAREQPTLAPETCIGVTKLRLSHKIYLSELQVVADV